MSNVYVARQPIFDGRMRVHGYELLFRSGDSLHANVQDADRATAEVIANTFTVIGFRDLVEDGVAFINITRAFLTDGGDLPLPPDRAVLEILETEQVDASLVEATARRVKEGYTIALDDFVFSEAWIPMLELAHIVKVDLSVLPRDELAGYVARLRRYGVRLVAEKVETQDDYDYCRQLGFDYFQGYFFSRPTVHRGSSIPQNHMSVLELISALQNPEADPNHLEKILSRDVSLSYRLLRYINSAVFADRQDVQSIKQAIMLLGLQALRRWASMVALAAVPNKPQELVKTLMVRGRMCETLVQSQAPDRKEAAFIAGLFSGLDALLDAPMPAVLEQLPLSPELSAALLEHQGLVGGALATVLAYEQSRLNELGQSGYGLSQLTAAYAEAVRWANETSQTF